MKTTRLTRLSVYVERKNVCKWSLVYLFLLTQFFLTFNLSSRYFFFLNEVGCYEEHRA